MSEGNPSYLHAVGDIALGDHPLCAGFGTHSRMRSRPPASRSSTSTPCSSGADLRFGNLECTLSETRPPAERLSLQSRCAASREYLQALSATGFHVLNVANNHSMQHGPRPFNETVEMLQWRGHQPCGSSLGRTRSACRDRSTAKGLRVGFLGYSLRPRQYFTETPLYAEGGATASSPTCAPRAPAHDIVVVSLHWGDEFIERPSPADVALAHAIIDAGADLIIGHHPHVLRGVERYGRGWIVYSLGNFVCDMLWDENPAGNGDLRVPAHAKMVCEDVRMIPARINDDSQPELLDGATAERLVWRLEKLTELINPEAVASAAALADYELAAEAAHSRLRAASHRYFLRNIYRFSPRTLAAQGATFVRNRLAERR